MFKYCNEIEIDHIKIEPLTRDNYYLVRGFSCKNEVLTDFLQKKALSDNGTKTYLFTYSDLCNKYLLGFCSFGSPGISFYNDYNAPKEQARRFSVSAIEINYFALDAKYSHMFWDEEAESENDEYFLSDILLNIAIKFIITNIRSVVGAIYILLYSIPKALGLYKRNGFKEFEDFMIPSYKRYLEGCIPMYLSINSYEIE